jgi:hypothetical protein
VADNLGGEAVVLIAIDRCWVHAANMPYWAEPVQAAQQVDKALGTLYAQIGRDEEAGAALSTAIDLYRAMDMTFWLPQAEAALGQSSG